MSVYCAGVTTCLMHVCSIIHIPLLSGIIIQEMLWENVCRTKRFGTFLFTAGRDGGGFRKNTSLFPSEKTSLILKM